MVSDITDNSTIEKLLTKLHTPLTFRPYDAVPWFWISQNQILSNKYRRVTYVVVHPYTDDPPVFEETKPCTQQMIIFRASPKRNGTVVMGESERP